ncbi:uncharacterized protein K02A2.6-like [Teleopsis dalmanni]|uniref:uncharacterized protein K02A2.6-like n=1 Tax=Teleopsis dalmanni TaxID=139649 RepID=UPI0018CEBF2F|nr:uncharacterized protein K02A2.6-like [Teleopsis dalmanni]
MSGVREFRPQVDSWCDWVEILDSHFVEMACQDDKIKRSILLKNIGMEAYGLLRDICDPDLPATQTYDKLCTLLGSHFSKPIIIFRERKIFFDAVREKGQTIMEWFALLKKLARNCKFGAQLNSFVLNKFVTALDGRTFERLCEEDETLTIERALKIAIITEAKNEAFKQQQTHDVEVNALFKRNLHFKGANSASTNKACMHNKNANSGSSSGSGSKKQRQSCKHCGWRNHESSSCKFKNCKCNNCGRVGHLANICLKKKTISIVNNNECKNFSNLVNNSDTNNFSIFSVDDKCHPKSPPPFVIDVEVNGVKLAFVLDSGAACSLLSKGDFHKHFGRIKLKKCNDQFVTYSGDIVGILGEFSASIKCRGQSHKLRIVVSDTLSRPVFGRDFMSLFGMEISTLSQLDDRVAFLKSRFSTVFAEGLGTYKVHKVKLSLKEDAKPVFCKPRPVPLAWRKEIERQIQDLVKKGVLKLIEDSDWGTPLVPVLKSNGELRICGDYKSTINKHLLDVRYPLPRIEELFASLKGQFFTKLDLSNAYNQLELVEESQRLCAWSTHLGIFKITRLPFGVKPAAAIFQKTIENALRGIPNVVNYLDDILISGDTIEEHSNSIEKVLKRLESVGLRLNANKCVFFQKTISYLGFDIDKNGLSKNQDRISAVVNAPIPNNLSEVRAFIGLVNYYSKFIPKFAEIMEPLYALLRKGVKFRWTKSCHYAYENLKKEITSDRFLASFDPSKPIILQTDASNVAIAGTLSHSFPNGTIKPIAFVSRALSTAERNYSAIQKEALAIVFAVTKLRLYLLGNKFVLQTDHKPLLSIFGENKGLPVMAAARIQRWALTLSGFDYTIEYVKGSENFTDNISRIPQDLLPSVDTEENSYINFITKNNELNLDFKVIAKETARDPCLAKVKAAIETGKLHLLKDKIFSPFQTKNLELSIECGCILWGFRSVIPYTLKNRVLKELHASHLGIVKTKALARSYVWWPNIDKDIVNLIDRCIPCKKVQPSPKKSPLIPWEMPSSVWSRIHIDFAGPVKNVYFLVVVDAYSKWVEIFKTKQITAAFTVEKLEELFCRYGLVDAIVSDNGTQFTAWEFQQFLKDNGIKQILTPPGFPATNGQAENFVKTFKKSLEASLSSGEKGSLDIVLKRFLFDYRTMKHCTTRESPAKLMLGREMKTRFDLLKPPLFKGRIQLS